ncbi:MAG: MFS transporter, partial [Pseudorhodoplanes sp.]
MQPSQPAETGGHTRTRLAVWALMFGNIATGLCILAPAAMLAELAAGLDVTIRDAGLLMTYGSALACIGSPVMAWVTSRIDRRILLVVTLAIVAGGQAASAFAPDYATLLAVRLLMLVAVVIYTPQAASTTAMIVAEKDRASAVSFVFVGWTLAIAGGMPVATSLAAHLGWREAYLALSAATALICILLMIGLPSRLQGIAISFRSWINIGHNPQILLLLLSTILVATGSFVITTYLGPLISRLADGGPTEIAFFFAIFGIMNLVGNVAVTRIVMGLGASLTSLVSIVLIG